MEKTNTRPKPLLLLLLTFIHLGLLLVVVSSLPSSFSPADHYLINCGSSNPSTVDSNHRTFNGDDDSLSSNHGFHFSPTRTFSLADPNPNTTPHLSSSIYNTARIFTKPSNYAFKIKQPGTHLLRLHFRGFNSSRFDLTNAQFRVFADGFLLMNDDSTSSLTQGEERIVEYILPVNNDKLSILFVPSGESKFGFVNAIEVISAPKDLILDVAQFVNGDGAVKFSGFSKNALETVYRVNVGGAKVTPFNDSLWRTWVTDGQFLTSDVGSDKVHFSGRIQYQMGGASREVGPDHVYNTARVIRSLNSSSAVSNMSWVFPVSKGYKYLIRTHFCDIASLSPNSLYFNVYVNGYLASKDLDASDITSGMLASPFYADFVVDGDSSGLINVSIGASKLSTPRGVDGILNGVEIMKLNNSMGSLDGVEFTSLHSLSGCWHSFGALVPLFAAIGLLMAAFMIVYRKYFGVNSRSWSRLPADASEYNLKQYGT